MYQKYQTETVVLASREVGEADKTYTLYTKDFGLVRARASAVRREASKMRYAMQNHALASVSLVRGKRGWRVAGARAVSSAPRKVDALSALARIAELTQKLVTGEERNEFLYETLSGAQKAFSRGGASEEIEILCVARVLYSLGYISNEALKSVLFTHADYSASDTESASHLKDKLLASSNHALTETHLVHR